MASTPAMLARSLRIRSSVPVSWSTCRCAKRIALRALLGLRQRRFRIAHPDLSLPNAFPQAFHAAPEGIDLVLRAPPFALPAPEALVPDGTLGRQGEIAA